MANVQILESPEVIAFREYFGIDEDPLDNPHGFIAAIAQLDPRYKGDRVLVRYELEANTDQWSVEAQTVIMDSARAMGMLEPETRLIGDWNLVIVLGGARQAPLDRLKYAAYAKESGVAQIDNLVIVGSSRKLLPVEQRAVVNYAPDAETEFDLCADAAKRVAWENPGLIVGQIFVIDEKAGTPDVIKKALAAFNADESTSVAVVTTQIYQRSTAFDLDRMFCGYTGFRSERSMVAGNPSDPAVIARRTPATYLSEVIRTLRAAALYTTEFT